jgi:hypothetical protein
VEKLQFSPRHHTGMHFLLRPGRSPCCIAELPNQHKLDVSSQFHLRIKSVWCFVINGNLVRLFFVNPSISRQYAQMFLC